MCRHDLNVRDREVRNVRNDRPTGQTSIRVTRVHNPTICIKGDLVHGIKVRESRVNTNGIEEGSLQGTNKPLVNTSGMNTQSGPSGRSVCRTHLYDRLSSMPHIGQEMGVSESQIFWVAAVWKPHTTLRTNKPWSSSGNFDETWNVSEWFGRKLPVPLRERFVTRKYGHACLKILQILSHESNARFKWK